MTQGGYVFQVRRGKEEVLHAVQQSSSLCQGAGGAECWQAHSSGRPAASTPSPSAARCRFPPLPALLVCRPPLRPPLNLPRPPRQPDNEEIRAAVKLWNSDKKAALATYGPIGGWNTVDVTNMDRLFYKMNKFNEDLPWNTSNVKRMDDMVSGGAGG